MAKKRRKPAPQSPRLVDCDEHESSPGCLICRHLCAARGLGYWAIRADASGPAQAWCDECDVALDRDRGWTDRALAAADFTVYCTFCYDKTLKRHKQRGWSVGSEGAEGPPRKKRAKKKSARR